MKYYVLTLFPEMIEQGLGTSIMGRAQSQGTISLKAITADSAEYAISTRRCAHGTGAAMAATSRILEIAFRELGLQRVYLNVLKDNGRANAFYRKAGFRFVREEENALTIRGEKKSLNWYEIER